MYWYQALWHWTAVIENPETVHEVNYLLQKYKQYIIMYFIINPKIRNIGMNINLNFFNIFRMKMSVWWWLQRMSISLTIRYLSYFFQVLKLYAWEMIFKDKIIDKRNLELRKLLNLKVLERIVETFFHITTFLVCKVPPYTLSIVFNLCFWSNFACC